jgi:outer membrane biosynthesis protein TonB
MKRTRLHPVMFALCALLLITACNKKRNKPVLLPQEQAPAVTTPQPEPEPQPQQPTQPPADQQPADTTENKPSQKPPATTAKNQKPHPARKPPQVAASTPPKIVITEGGTGSGSDSIGLGQPGPAADAAHNQFSTEQLLDRTEANLRSIKRLLTRDEQSLATQIRDFISQSRQATKDGELVRARNLAVKANLLSDELVKPK